MLDALALVGLQVLLDLALVVLRLIDGMRMRPQGLVSAPREESGLLALDIEVADLAKIEQALVEARPIVHAPAHHVVRQMVDAGKTRGLRACAVFDRAKSTS